MVLNVWYSEHGAHSLKAHLAPSLTESEERKLLMSRAHAPPTRSDIDDDEHLRVAGRLADLHGAVRDRLDLRAADVAAAVKALAPPGQERGLGVGLRT